MPTDFTHVPFVPGLDLAARFFKEAVGPLLNESFPQLTYSAGHLGHGSDVLGYDTPQSRDHDWGPRLTLFLSERDYQNQHQAIDRRLAEDLPPTLAGYPTHYDQEGDKGVRWMAAPGAGPIRHGITITTPNRFFGEYAGHTLETPLTERDWLLIPQQRLCTIASGRVFHDGLCCLETRRALLHWYPPDIWRYLLACQWQRIAQEEAFMARCGDVDDDLGSRWVAMRLITQIMRVGFLLERQYAPYIKWFGTAFRHLACAPRLLPLFARVMNAPDWHEREAGLTAAFVEIGERQNASGLAESVTPEASPFFDRPYLVPKAERYVQALVQELDSPWLRTLPLVGSVDQFVDSTDVLNSIERCKALASLYDHAALHPEP